MEAEAQKQTPRSATYEILMNPDDPMHPVNRLVKGMNPKLDLPAAFTLRDPLDGEVTVRSFPGLQGTYQDGYFRLDGRLSSDVVVTGRLNMEADDQGVIGSLRLTPNN